MEVSLRLTVRGDGDVVHRERRARDLRDTIAEAPAVRDTGTSVDFAPPGESEPGAKGAVEAAVVLVVAGAPYARPVADAVVAVVQAWCARDRRATVVVHRGDRSVELRGDPTEEQRALLEEVLRDRDGDEG